MARAELMNTQTGPIVIDSTKPSMIMFDNLLKTFKGWPSKIVTPTALAKSGFYYTNKNDTVKCAFCNMKVNKWAEGDVPEQIHKQLSPQCPFVQNKYQHFEDQKPAMYPKFKKLEKRMETFEDWPISLAQRPEILSRAGFFYTGKGDRTLCFACGVGLKDWEKDDEPWQEHAKWSSNCEYLIFCKGKEYVIEICDKYKIKHNLESTKPTVVNSIVNETNKPERTDKLCLMCCNQDIQVVFLPCGHACACRECGFGQDKCPMCRSNIESINNLYLP